MKEDFKLLMHWISERESIRKRRKAGEPWPWTDDPILRGFSFCNVRREDDRVTRWIANNWREPHAEDPHLFMAMATARYINWPETLDQVGYPVPFDRDRIKSVLNARTVRGDKVFGPAYVIPNGGSSKAKIDYVVDDILYRLWRSREHLVPSSGLSLARYLARLTDFKGVGGFLAGQIIADLKYAGPLREAPDWTQFAVSGPGSRQSLNRIMGRSIDAAWTAESSWLTVFRRFETDIRPELERIGLGDLHCQDLQNCLCEFDKFARAFHGEGKPKRRYAAPVQQAAE